MCFLSPPVFWRQLQETLLLQRTKNTWSVYAETVWEDVELPPTFLT